MASVTILLVLVDVVAEVRRVPDDHVLAADVFPVDKAIDGYRSVRLWVTSLAGQEVIRSEIWGTGARVAGATAR